MNIGIILDHPKRDLAGVVMIAHALAVRGHTTSIVPLYDQAVDIPLLGLDALIVNYARPANLSLIQAYATMGVPVFVLDTEGGILAEDGANAPDQLACYVSESGYANILSGYFFWGSRLRDAFAKSSGIAPQKLHVTGCPRFDFASPRWEAILDAPWRDYILVNANFPLVNPLFARSSEEETMTLVHAGWKVDYVAQMLSDSRKIFTGYLRTIFDLATHFPQHTFLVRPHPFENANVYRESLSALSNVIVDGRGSVLNVIRHAKCVLHLNCGTAVEATMLRRLPVSMEFLNTDHMSNHSTLPSKISLRANSYEEMCSTIENLDAATGQFSFEQNYSENILPWFHLNDGRAADRVADVMVQYGAAARSRVKPSVARSLASSRSNSSVGQRAQALLANLTGSKFSSRLREMRTASRREKRLDAKDVRLQLEKIATHAGTALPSVAHAQHPWSGLELATVRVEPIA